MKLNLGCGKSKRDGFIGVDVAPTCGADQIADLSQPWPWDTSSIEEVFASHLFEHLPNRIHTMNELHRVLQPGGIATIEVPNAAKGAGFFQDPTHCAPWCRNSFQYFRAGSYAQQVLAESYGITAAFQVVSMQEYMYQDEYEEVWNIVAVLRAVK